MKRYLWILALAVTAAAQEVAVELVTPTLGYIYDEQARTLRAIEGVPGAASIGSPMHLGAGLDFVSVAPSRSYAFGYENGSESLLLLRLDGNAGAARTSLLPRARAWFSPSGEVAVFDLGERVEIWGGLPDQPRRIGEMAAAGLRPDRMAVSDDGGMVAVLVDGDLYRLTPEAPQRLAQGVRDVAFLRATRDLFALHPAHLVRFGKGEPDSAETVLAGLDEAAAFAISRDQKYIAITGESLTVAELRSGSALPLDAGETRFDAIARAEGDAVFQLHASTGETWLLDADGAPRLLAVAARGNQ